MANKSVLEQLPELQQIETIIHQHGNKEFFLARLYKKIFSKNKSEKIDE